MNNLKKRIRYFISPSTNICWASHKIGTEFVMPADAYIEITSVAIKTLFSKNDVYVTDVKYHSILATKDENYECKIELLAVILDGNIAITISELLGQNERLLFSANINTRRESISDTPHNLKENRFAISSSNLTYAELYLNDDDNYIGDLYKVITDLRFDDSWIEVNLDFSKVDFNSEMYLTSPYVLNAALVAMINVSAKFLNLPKSSFLPSSIGSLQVKDFRDLHDIKTMLIHIKQMHDFECQFDLIAYSKNSDKIVLLATGIGIRVLDNKDKYSEENDKIAVIGMAGIFPDAKNVTEFWGNLYNSKCSVKEITNQRWKSNSRLFAGFLDNIDLFAADFFKISGIEAKQMDPQQRLFLQTCWQALEDAGYALEKNMDSLDCGVYVGAVASDYLDFMPQAQREAQSFWGNSGSAIPARIAYFLNLTGPAVAFDTACSSSLYAIHAACNSIRGGECSMALAGGAFLMLTEKFHSQASKADMLSGDGICKAFANDANGFVPGEAVAAIVLKPFKQAVIDQDQIYAVIMDSASNQDGRSNGLTAPNINAQVALLNKIYKKIDPQTIGYVEAHGTGTKLGDPIEFEALNQIFMQNPTKKRFCALGSVKTNIGHTALAAGISGFIKLLLMIKNRKILPSLHFTSPNELIDFQNSAFYVPTSISNWTQNTPIRGAISSFGFSGTNVHMVVEEAPIFTRGIPREQYYLIPISAFDAASLMLYLDDIKKKLIYGSVELLDVAYTLAIRRKYYNTRVIFCVNSISNLIETITNYQNTGAVTEHNVIDVLYKNKIIEFLAGNEDVDFSFQFQNLQPKNAILPLSPMPTKRYWFNLDQELCDSENKLFIKMSVSKQDFYVAEHIVHGQNIFPAIGYFLLIEKFVQNKFNLPLINVRIYDLIWRLPLVIHTENKTIYFTFVKQESSYSFTIHDENQEYCTGNLMFLEKQPANHIYSEWVNMLLDVSGQQLYEQFSLNGLSYGPRMRTIIKLGTQLDYAAASLDANCGTEFSFNPSLLDGALQMLGAFSLLDAQNKDATYLPFSLEKVDFYKELPSTCYAIANKIDAYTFNIELCNINMEKCVVFTGLGARKYKDMQNVDAFIPYEEIWSPTELSKSYVDSFDYLLLFAGNLTYENIIKRELDKIGHAVIHPIIILEGDNFVKLSETLYAVNFYDQDCMEKLFGEFQGKIGIINFLAQIAFSAPSDIWKAIQNIVVVAKISAAHKVYKTVYVYEINGANALLASMLDGAIRCLKYELPDIIFILTSIENCSNWIGSIIQEFMYNHSSSIIAYKGNKRHTKSLDKFELNKHSNSKFIKNGCYVITGGMGGIGKHLALYLAKNYNANILLIGRKRLNEENTAWLNSVQPLYSIHYAECDVTDSNAIHNVFSWYHNNYGKINGVFHAVAILLDNLISNVDLKDISSNLGPKVFGTINIESLTNIFEFDFVVLFSSLSAIVGNAGQTLYAAANSFLRGFLENTKQDKTKWICISWPYWQEGGMKVPEPLILRMQNDWKLNPITTNAALSILENIMNSNVTNIVIANSAFNNVYKRIDFPKEINSDKEILDKPSNDVAMLVRDAMAEILDVDKNLISKTNSFNNLGLDSLLVVKIVRKLEFYFGKLPATLLFEYDSFDKLTSYLRQIKKNSVPDSEHTQIIDIPLMENMPDDIAIIGLSGRYPQSQDLHKFADVLRTGQDCITKYPHDRNPNTPYNWGGFINDIDKFDPIFFDIVPKDAEIMDPQERLFLETAWHAIEDAGYTRDVLKKYQVGVFVGVMYGLYQMYGINSETTPLVVNSSYSSIANRVSYFIDAHGPSLAIDTMCSSSLTSLHIACQSIKNGECDIAIVGGVNVISHPYKYVELMQKNMLAADGRCRSFGENGTGYVPGEGVGAIVIKKLRQSIEDRDQIYAIIRGSAIGHDGSTFGYTVPNPNAQADIIINVLEKTQIDPRTIGYIEAHGTGTKLGDPIEIRGLQKAFEKFTEQKNFCAIGSVKSNIGHLESAAGIAAITKVILQMQEKVIFPSLHAEIMNPEINFPQTPFYLNNTLKNWNKPVIDERVYSRRAGISSFGAAGSNAHVILEEYNDVRLTNNEQVSYMFAWSAKRPELLRLIIVNMLAWLEANETNKALLDISYTLLVGREHYEYRFAVIAKSFDELKLKIVNWLQGNFKQEKNKENDRHLQKTLIEYLAGSNIQLESMFSGLSPFKISLPGYPYKRKSYWAKSDKNTIGHGLEQQIKNKFLYIKNWNMVENNLGYPAAKKQNYILLVNPNSGNKIISMFDTVYPASNLIIITVLANNVELMFQHVKHKWNVNIKEIARIIDYIKLLQLSSCVLLDFCDIEAVNVDAQLSQGRFEFWQLLIAQARTMSLDIFHFSYDITQSACADDSIFMSFVKSIGKEHQNLNAKNIQLDMYSLNDIVSIVNIELQITDYYEVKYINSNRYIPTFSPVRLAHTGYVFNPQHTYIVTGGTRGIGAQICEYLVGKGVTSLFITGFEPLPERNMWPSILIQENVSNSLKKKINFIKSLESKGCAVHIYCGSLTNKLELEKHLKLIRANTKPIKGIFHCAGTIAPEAQGFIYKDYSKVLRILEPKSKGIEILNQLTKCDQLDFVMLFSSVSSIVPVLSAGISDYGAANNFLNYFADIQNNKNKTKYYAIQWPFWAKDFNDKPSDVYQKLNLDVFNNFEGICALDMIISQNSPVFNGLVSSRSDINSDEWLKVPKVKNAVSNINTTPNKIFENLNLLKIVREAIIKIAKFSEDELDDNRVFEQYGMDSIILAELLKTIENKLNISLSPVVVLENNTVNKLVNYLNYNNAMSKSVPSTNVQHTTFAQDAPKNLIAVIGMAVKVPGADTLENYWQNILTERVSIGYPSYNRAKSLSVKYQAGYLNDIAMFDYEYFKFSKQQALSLDPLCRIFMHAANDAMHNAGYTFEEYYGATIGVFVGARSSNYVDLLGTITKETIIGVGQNFIASHVSNFGNFKGPALVVDTACSSSLVAVHLACQSLISGESTMAIAGGIDLFIDKRPFDLLSNAQALSQTGKCRPFDSMADGIVIGEGCGAVILKPLEQAISDGNNIYAVICGSATNNDGRTMGHTTPNPAMQKEVINKAWDKAGINPNKIKYIEAHGTGTLIGDPMELQSLTDAFKQLTTKNSICSIGSVKANIGHLLSAAGIASFIKTSLLCYKRKIPCIVNCEHPNPRYKFDNSPLFINREIINIDVTETFYAGMNGFGFGGTNAHVLLSSFDKNLYPDYRQQKFSLKATYEMHSFWPIINNSESVMSNFFNFNDVEINENN